MKGEFDPTIYISRISLSADPNSLEGYICDHRIDEENNVLYYYSEKEGLTAVTLTNQYLSEQTGQDFSVIEEQIKANPENVEQIIDGLFDPLQRFKAQHIAKMLPATV